MRNIFDYYKQNENQLTHALFSTLTNDNGLLDSFMRDICGIHNKRAKDMKLSVQRYPSARAYTEEEIESRGIPDAWIYDDSFALVFEAKITANVEQAQLASHENTARRHGFDNVPFYTITAEPNIPPREGWQNIRWHDIYIWLREKEKDYPWAKNTADYFELLEARMCEEGQLNNGNITAFTGFPSYEDGYNYLVAKNTLKKAMDELRNKEQLRLEMRMNPTASGRPSITGKNQTRVWDCLPIGVIPQGKNFSYSLHLTLGINETSVEASITIPDKIATSQKNKIKNRGIEPDGTRLNEELGEDKFIDICQRILNNMTEILDANPGAKPILRGIQRHFLYQRLGIIDGLIEVDLRTYFETNDDIKYQNQWLKVIYDVFCNKNSNYQMQIGINFPYGEGANIQDPNALDLITRAWLTCEPLVELCQPENPN